MIIFINGAFGVGKTTVAEMLVQRISNSLLFDPEKIGCVLHRINRMTRPVKHVDDFQDLPVWRTLTVATTRFLLKTSHRTLIIPMTIWHRPYFDEVIGGIKQFEPDFYHFCLTADAETISRRLAGRDNRPQAYSWAYVRIERCVEAFKGEEFAMQVETDGKGPEEIVEEIVSYLPDPYREGFLAGSN